MEKKNPFIMTVGFKKEDLDHVYVAGLLNTMGRGKAQYIVKAVLAYQVQQQKGNLPYPSSIACDYESIKRVVIQVIEEREKQKETNISIIHKSEREAKIVEQKEHDLLQGFDADAMNDILASIAAFQEQ